LKKTISKGSEKREIIDVIKKRTERKIASILLNIDIFGFTFSSYFVKVKTNSHIVFSLVLFLITDPIFCSIEEVSS